MSREKALIAFLAIIVAVWFAARQVGKHEADVWWQSHCPAVSQKAPAQSLIVTGAGINGGPIECVITGTGSCGTAFCERPAPHGEEERR